MADLSDVLTLIFFMGMIVFFCLELAYFANNLNCGCALFGDAFTITLIVFSCLCLLYVLSAALKYMRIVFVGPQLRFVEA